MDPVIKKDYYEIYRLVGHIYEPNKSACQEVLKQHWDQIQKAPGSLHNHQAWRGGYLDHVQEVMNIARVLYDSLNAQRPLPFSLSDALLVLFLHDIEKPWRFKIDGDGVIYEFDSIHGEAQKREFRRGFVERYNFELTAEQWSALEHVEGEKEAYSPLQRTMNPLAAFCHLCDVASARLWFDFPKHDGSDPWPGVECT